MNAELQQRISRNLAKIESENLTRKLHSPRGIDFSSNDYLALANDARLKQAAMAAIEREGVGATASRLLRGERESFAAVERQFAVWKKTERALFFNSGYQANIGLLTTFLESGDVVFSDELNHASLIDGMRLSKAQRIIFKHRDVDSVHNLLRETKTDGQKFLVTESLFSMNGTIAPLEKYAEICAATNTNLIVDEAHAVGVFGANGGGLIEETGIENEVFLSINTAGKALGVSGAFVAGNAIFIEYLIQKARTFIFSTAPLPAVADSVKTAIEIVQNEKERREKLLHLSSFLRRLLIENNIKVSLENSQIVPIFIGASGEALIAARAMQDNGFDVRAIRPPTVPPNTARLRVSLNAGLTEEILQRFVDCLAKIICK